MPNQTQLVAVVTGANKGIGYETVKQLAHKKVTVYLGARDKGRGEEAVAKLRKEGLSNVHFLQIDITSEESIRKAAAHVEKEHGYLSTLINNAGIVHQSLAPSKETLENLQTTFATNYFGAVMATNGFLPLLRKSEHKTIVNVSSGLGSIALHNDPDWPYHGVNILAYNSSKSALNAYTVLLAKELRAEGFRVNAMNPGYVATDINNNQGPGSAADGAKVSVQCALLSHDGPTGSFVTAGGNIPWWTGLGDWPGN